MYYIICYLKVFPCIILKFQKMSNFFKKIFSGGIVSKKNLTKLFAFIAVFSWASSFVSTKILLTNNYVTANDLGIIRYFFASILVLIIALVMKLKKPKSKGCAFIFSGRLFRILCLYVLFEYGTFAYKSINFKCNKCSLSRYDSSYSIFYL